MSSVDGSRLTLPKRGWLALRTPSEIERPERQSLRSYLLDRSASVARDAWHKFRADKNLHAALLWGGAAWLILQMTFVAWAHMALEGETHRAFLPGTRFGIPERETVAGLRSITYTGYDGQCYYLLSNDLFGRHDAYKHCDGTYMYRYQRIGVPMLAGGLATLLGYELTPPLLYHSVQFGLTALGFAALVYWLKTKGLHPAYALGWLLSGGTLYSLWVGILDAPADAVFVFAFLAVMSRRLWLYVPLASLLLLTREGYAVYAFAVFLATVAGRIGWQDNLGQWRPLARVVWRDASNYWSRVVLTAVPGVLMLAWSFYLAWNFHLRPFSHHVNELGTTSWPFNAMIECTDGFWRTSNWLEFKLALVTGFTLVLVSVLMCRNFKRLTFSLACSLPYVLLVACFGKMVWEYHAGFMKSNGTIIILGLLMLPIDKSILLRFMLGLQAVVGVNLESDRMLSPSILSEHFLHEQADFPPDQIDGPDNPVLDDLRSTVIWTKPETRCVQKYDGLFNRVHRELKPMTIAITNNSDITWQPGRGKHPIWLGYTLYNDSGEKQLCQHSIVLDRPLAPGETCELTTYVELRRKLRKYVVEFSLWQDGPGWFVKTDASFGSRYEFTVE